MAKRQADSYLTDRNWDEEDETEEAGEFKKADTNTLATRKIKTAKRRTDNNTETSGTGGIFKSFTGFTSSSTASSSKSGAFCFGGIQSKCLGSSSKDNESTEDVSKSTKNGSASTSAATAEVTSTASTTAKNGSNNSKYMSQLKALNSSVEKWIREHVESNPYCILTPIFTDYEKHLKEIEQKYGDGAGKEAEKKPSPSIFGGAKSAEAEDTKEADKSKSSPFSSPAKTTAGLFSFGAKAPTAAFTFGGSTNSSKPLGAPGGLSSVPAFGTSTSTNDTSTSGSSTSATTSSATSSSSTAPPTATGSLFGGLGAFGAAGTSGFTFNRTGDTTGAGGGGVSSVGGGAMGGAGFSFGTIKPAASGDGGGSSENVAHDGEEEYVPPEPEPSSITEDDAFYTKRCKLFYKVGDDWKDYGVGNLFLKPCEEKTQLLVRADTSLGNILLNILVPATFPASRSGKNNVLVMCVPNPPLQDKKVEEGKPVSMLIRVKTGEEADELLEKLKEAKEKAAEK